MDNNYNQSNNPVDAQSKNQPTRANPNETNQHLQQTVVSKDILKNSGKEVGLVDPPIVPLSPTSGTKNKSKEEDIKIFSDISELIGDDGDEDYPYEKLKVDQGFFLPTQPNSTTDVLVASAQKSIEQAKKRYGTIEVDAEGNELWEVLTTRTKKRNNDGTVQLEGGKPILGADYTHRPKYIYTRNFIVKAVVKGQKLNDGEKAEGDGVVVIRVA